jgi:protein-disulfide isomerase
VKDYNGQVRVVFKNFVVHPQVATIPAMAACAAGQQGKFVEMKNAIFDKAFASRDFGQDNMEKLAKDVGLDMDKFKSDMQGDKCKNQLAKDAKDVTSVGVNGTPAFFINGRYLSGAQPIEQFKQLIDEEMKKVDSSGMDPVAYYKKNVIDGGKKSL